MAEPKKIEEIWAWVCTDPDGGEGVPARTMVIASIAHMVPMLGADRARVESLRKQAIEIASLTGASLKLMRFSTAEVVETITIQEHVH